MAICESKWFNRISPLRLREVCHFPKRKHSLDFFWTRGIARYVALGGGVGVVGGIQMGFMIEREFDSIWGLNVE